MNATAVRRLGLPEYAVPVTRRPRADAPCAWRGRWRVSRAGLVPGGAHGVPACGRHDERRGRPGPQLGTTRPCLVEFFMWGSIADATPGRSRLPPARPSASALIPDEAWPRRSFVVRGRGLGFHASAVPVPRRPRADAPCASRGRWRVSRAGLVPGGAHGVPACGRHDESCGRPAPRRGGRGHAPPR